MKHEENDTANVYLSQKVVIHEIGSPIQYMFGQSNVCVSTGNTSSSIMHANDSWLLWKLWRWWQLNTIKQCNPQFIITHPPTCALFSTRANSQFLGALRSDVWDVQRGSWSHVVMKQSCLHYDSYNTQGNQSINPKK